MNEIYITAKAGNNCLRMFREGAGFKTRKALADATGIDKGSIGDLESFKKSPRKICSGFGVRPNYDIGWSKPALMLANFFGVEPEEIFPPGTWYLKGGKPVVREISLSDLMQLPGEAEYLALPSPEDITMRSELREQVEAALRTLTPREKRVIEMRFGIGENSDHTLEEVGQDFEVTRERIRQIEAKALRKMRHPSRSKNLRQFIE